MGDKDIKARKIVDIFDDFLNDKLTNRGIELNCSIPYAAEEAKKKEPRMFDTNCMRQIDIWYQLMNWLNENEC